MSMTQNDWNAWSVEKRKFYADLFACYLIADDGMLRIDTVKRRNLVREQLAKQAIAGSEQIITRSTSANYIIADALQADGKTLKSAAEVDRIQVLCSERGEINTMKAIYPIAHEGEEVDFMAIIAQADAAAENKEPAQYSLVGGFKRPEQAISEHFADVVKAKMLGGTSFRVQKAPVFLSLGPINDLTFFSRCSLDPVEKQFLFEDPIFRGALHTEAQRLSAQVMKGTISAEELEQQIIKHINLCSAQKSNQKSLAALSIPRVETYLAVCTRETFERISFHAINNVSEVGSLGFKGELKLLKRYLVDGLLKFTFPPEFRNLLKAYFLLQGPFGGQNIAAVARDTEHFIAGYNSLTTLLEITREQIKDIIDGCLPSPPADMGIKWDLRRSPEKILNILKNAHCLDLYNIAEMAGFSRDNAHHAFGLESPALMSRINAEIHKLWDQETPRLLQGIDRALRQQKRELEAGWRNAAATLEDLMSADQPAGIKLALEPPKAVLAVAPGNLGLFPAAAIAAPKSKMELLREAAEKRLAENEAKAAAARRAALLEAEVVDDDAADEDEDDERARMRRA